MTDAVRLPSGTAAPASGAVTSVAAAPARAGRDLRLDFFRGLSLIFIFIDHIPENVLAHFTLRAIAFNDAAEVFIFISGYTAALVYGQSLRQTGRLYATAQIYRRVWQLYVAHIFLFMIFIAEVSYTLVLNQNPMYLEELGVGNFLQAPHIAIIRALALDFQPSFLDILPLYIVLLGTFPPVLLALAEFPLVPLVLSGALYVLTLTHGWAFYTYPAYRVWYFNPLAWQFLFIIGAWLGHSGISGRRPRRMPRWLALTTVGICALLVAINLTWLAHSLYDPFKPLLARQLWKLTLDKTDLAPLRLFNFLVLAASVVYFVKPETRFLRLRALRPIIVCGQHSLYVFCFGILLSVMGHFVLTDFQDGAASQVIVNILGIAAMMALAALLNWFKSAGRRYARLAAGASPPTGISGLPSRPATGPGTIQPAASE